LRDELHCHPACIGQILHPVDHFWIGPEEGEREPSHLSCGDEEVWALVRSDGVVDGEREVLDAALVQGVQQGVRPAEVVEPRDEDAVAVAEESDHLGKLFHHGDHVLSREKPL